MLGVENINAEHGVTAQVCYPGTAQDRRQPVAPTCQACRERGTIARTAPCPHSRPPSLATLAFRGAKEWLAADCPLIGSRQVRPFDPDATSKAGTASSAPCRESRRKAGGATAAADAGSRARNPGRYYCLVSSDIPRGDRDLGRDGPALFRVAVCVYSEGVVATVSRAALLGAGGSETVG